MTDAPGGRLVVVGTPIGNLDDLSPRGRAALEAADVVVCEDSRRTGRLLQLLGIGRRPLVVGNEHTEHGRRFEVLDRIRAGERVVLVSDAGMPVVSDPGRRLVAAVADAGLPIEVVPGPTAIGAAVAISGFPGDRFLFLGFLARKGNDRAADLHEVHRSTRPVVIYESPKRVAATLADLVDACGDDRRICVARELTKLHEEVVRGRLADVATEFAERRDVKGEFVLVVEGGTAAPVEVDDDAIRRMLAEHLGHGASRRDAVAEVVAATGIGKRRVYDLANRL